MVFINFFVLIFKVYIRLPSFVMYYIYDLCMYIYTRGWKRFYGWGVHLFTGRFGAGKTSCMVHLARKYAKKYSQLTVLTNMELSNFPKHTKILKLETAQDILNAPQDCIVLIDEIGTIFNSRDFSSGKTAVPKVLFQHLCQCRHRRMMIYGTVQRFNLLDKQIRDISADVTTCSIHFKHPFSRLCTMRTFDIDEFETLQSNRLYKPVPYSVGAYIQRNESRNLYDTTEMVNGMLRKEYLSDTEILENRGEYQPTYTPLDKSAKKSYYRRNRY